MGKRQVIEVPGITHGANPIPAAVRIGNMLFSGGISGQDPDNGSAIPPEPERQTALMFANVRRLLAAAGGSTDDIAHVAVSLKDLKYRALINTEWLKMFPDEHDRPTRHTQQYDLAGAMLVQCQITAVLD